MLLDWSVSTVQALLGLKSLIIFQGPGSWRREARWDEYVVQLHNLGQAPLRIESAELVDVLGQVQKPGIDPWKLEDQSSTNWQKYGKSGLNTLIGTGGAVLAYAASTGLTATTGFMMTGGGSALKVAGAAITVVFIAEVGAVDIMDEMNRDKVQAEFARRRIALPQPLAPAASVSGSLFFPLTPGPRRLIVRGSCSGAPMVISLELSQLGELHLAPKR